MTDTKKASIKTEANIAIRPRVGSALARVRAAATQQGASMPDLLHNVVEVHETEIMNQLTQAPPDVPFD